MASPSRPPRRPPAWEEAASNLLFFGLAPRLPEPDQPPVPPELAPWEEVAIARRGGDEKRDSGTGGAGTLSGVFFPAPEDRPAKGAVLLLHPWLQWGKAYFYRRGRIEALRRAGYHCLIFDLPGFGGSAPRRRYRYLDLDVADALAALAARAGAGGQGEPPLLIWGVSAGGYWTHPVLSDRRFEVAAAFYEDVSPHLLEWSWRTAPLGRPFYLVFRTLFRRAYRYFDLRRHAPHLAADSVAYVSGERDRGVRPEDTRELARRAGGEVRIVERARHLASIKLANDEVIELALATFRRGQAGSPAASVDTGRADTGRVDTGRADAGRVAAGEAG